MKQGVTNEGVNVCSINNPGFSGVYGNYYDPRPHLKPGHVFLERFLVPHFDERAGHCNKPSTKINPALSLVTKKHVNPPDRRLPHSNIRIYKKSKFYWDYIH